MYIVSYYEVAHMPSDDLFSKDPGYIKRLEDVDTRKDAEDPLLTIDLNNSSIWTGNWSQLCPTCKRNKRDFFIFVCMAMSTSLISIISAVQRIWTAPLPLHSEETWIHHVLVQHPGVVVFLVLDAVVLTAATTLTTVQASQIARNITTNEMANAIRYGYLRGPDGKFRNPYNHGCRKNCSDFFINGYTNDDEIAWPQLQQVAS
ncbi:hypothetical protein Pint_33529 [Pistacia integerrima]|uniref:Uncharacterized protein n=1 Tax=Pistacia integerrima TaxID=434235 RepID=A0ACC0X8M5_9ROSI|nr:hypothetical protein Pint_33529 [Pistacia integerrima]